MRKKFTEQWTIDTIDPRVVAIYREAYPYDTEDDIAISCTSAQAAYLNLSFALRDLANVFWTEVVWPPENTSRRNILRVVRGYIIGAGSYYAIYRVLMALGIGAAG